MFTEIDINGDGNMSWNEFIQEIINQVESQTIRAKKDIQTNKEVSILEQIRTRDLLMVNEFVPANKIDSSRHRKDIISAVYCPELQLFLLAQEKSDQIQVVDSDLQLVWQQQLKSTIAGSFVTGVAIQGISKGSEHIGLVGTQGIFGVVASDSHIHLYAKTKTNIRLWRSVKTPVLMKNIWYLSQLKMWATAGKDFKLYLWQFGMNQDESSQVGQPLSLHSDEITDCLEISEPKCICTCGMDRAIVMYDFVNKYVLRVIKNAHDNSIRKMTYIKQFGGILVSVAYDMLAKVWQPSNLYGEALLGKLKGHNHPLVSVENLPDKPFVVTVDTKNTIMIWDVRSLTCAQTIASKQKKECTGLVVFNRNEFWTYNSRFSVFQSQDSKQIKEKIRQTSHQGSLTAVYNHFFDVIVVSDNQDIYLYQSQNGKVSAIHENLFNDTSVKTLQLVQDKRSRKVYAISDQGQFKIINVQNGVQLSEVNLEAQLRLLELNSLDVSPVKGIKAQTKPLVSMQLVWNDHIKQVIACDDESYMIFDDNDETPMLLRRVTGAHQEEICIVKYSFHLSLVATGCVNGELAIWDYESSQLQKFLFCHSKSITGLEFLTPRPLLLSCGLDARVCIWTVRPAYFKQRYICIYQFIHKTLNTDSNDEKTAIRSCEIMKPGDRVVTQGFRIPDHLNADTYRNYRANTVLSQYEHKIVMDENEVYRGPNAIKRIRAEYVYKYQTKLDENGLSYVDREFARRTAKGANKQFRRPKEVPDNFQNVYLFLGDEAGFIKVWDLSVVLHQCGIEECLPYIETDLQFYPNRSEIVNASAWAESLRTKSTTNPDQIPVIDPFGSGIILMEVLAHRGPVTSLNYSSLRHSLFSCCELTRVVRVWDPLTMNLEGEINQNTLKQDKLWVAKTAEKSRQQDVVDQLQTILKTDFDIPTEIQVDPEQEIESQEVCQVKIKERIKLKGQVANEPEDTQYKDEMTFQKLNKILKKQEVAIRVAKAPASKVFDNLKGSAQLLYQDLNPDQSTIEQQETTKHAEKRSVSVVDKLHTVNQSDKLLQKCYIGHQSKRSSNQKQTLVSLKCLPTIRDKIPFLKTNFNLLSMTDRLKTDLSVIQLKDYDTDIQSYAESSLPYIPIDSTQRNLSVMSSQLNLTRDSSVRMLNRDKSQMESVLSQRSASQNNYSSMKQIKVQRKMDSYQNIKNKYLGENASISTILSSAREMQIQQKQKLKALSSIII